MANRGTGNMRPVGGTLFLTNQRLFFEPHVIERMTQEERWEAPRSNVRLRVGPGEWNPHVPILRDVALRYHLEVVQISDGETEDFFVTHIGEPVEELVD
jgi:hypothetical protein